jgi:hypothetical protein
MYESGGAMGRFDDELKQDLYSGDAARVQSAIRNLRERMRKGDEIKIPPFGVEILDAFGDDVPQETQLDFITLVGRYHSFIPEKSDREKKAALVALVLRYAERHIAFEVAMKLKISPDPVQAVKIALDEIVRQGLASPRNVKGAKYLVSRLLDGKDEVRKATLEALLEWPTEPPFQEAIEYVIQQLEPHEREVLNQGRQKV